MKLLKLVVLSGLLLVASTVRAAEELRAGIIGLDTSHAVAFTKALNADKPAPEHAGVRVTVAYPKGSATIESSVKRVPKYTEQVKALGVEIVDSIEAMLEKCDVVFLESNDGRVHLEQAIPVFKSGKRVFIDKPVAGSLAHCLALYEAAERYKVPMFSTSSLRYTEKMCEIVAGKYGPVKGASTFSPCALEESHPDLFWYGIHGVEMLFTLMGAECESVVRVSTPGADVVTGVWKDDRIGTFRGTRNSRGGYGGRAFFDKSIQSIDDFKGYGMMLGEIVKFFKSGEAPVSAEETIAIFAFMEAADESKRRGGVPVKTADVIAQARAEAVKLRIN